MSKNNYVIPPQILEVLGPPPLLASENPKRWNETLARFARSFPPKDPDDFEGWKNVWNLACDHWEEERMKRFKVEVLEAPYRAKLHQELLARVDKVEDELRTQAFDQVLAQWRRPAESNEKLAAEAQTIPTVTATEPAPLLPPATDVITPMLSRRTCISTAAPTKFRTRRASATMLFATRLTFGALPSWPAKCSTVRSHQQSANLRAGKSRLWST